MKARVVKTRHSFALKFGKKLTRSTKLGDRFEVSLQPSGQIVLVPLKSSPSKREIAESIKSALNDYARTMKRLAKAG